jgi:hypothetical protein
LNITVKTLALNYESLAQRGIELNNSYLSLLKIYDEINFVPELLTELAKSGESPFKVITAMELDRQKLLTQLTNLGEAIERTTPHFTSNPELAELSSIAHDSKLIQDFVTGIDLHELNQMFINLNQ